MSVLLAASHLWLVFVSATFQQSIVFTGDTQIKIKLHGSYFSKELLYKVGFKGH